jgi:hypothetical protein
MLTSSKSREINDGPKTAQVDYRQKQESTESFEKNNQAPRQAPIARRRR